MPVAASSRSKNKLAAPEDFPIAIPLSTSIRNTEDPLKRITETTELTNSLLSVDDEPQCPPQSEWKQPLQESSDTPTKGSLTYSRNKLDTSIHSMPTGTDPSELERGMISPTQTDKTPIHHQDDDHHEEATDSLGSAGAGPGPISYCKIHRPNKRAMIESVSEVETDPGVQRQQEEMLKAANRKIMEENKAKAGTHQSMWVTNRPIICRSLLIFAIFMAAACTGGLLQSASRDERRHSDAHTLALEAGEFLSAQLDRSVLPLYSMAKFAKYMPAFHELAHEIGIVGQEEALPLNIETWRRNVTGVCDVPELVSTFENIASGLAYSTQAGDTLRNIQMIPNGVVCLDYTAEEVGSTSRDYPIGHDLLNNPEYREDTKKWLQLESFNIQGPLLSNASDPESPKYFVARMPVEDDDFLVEIDGAFYPRWGYVATVIDWSTLLEQSGILAIFDDSMFEFQLTRTDLVFDDETQEYKEVLVVLAESLGFTSANDMVPESIDSIDGEWVMYVAYDEATKAQRLSLIIGISFIGSALIAILVFIVMSQKKVYVYMLAENSAQEAKVNAERNMTAYFAHELRNPLSALDSALNTIALDELPESTKELLDGMKLCSSFMSSIMNNLLDVRKIEEGKMRIRSSPISLSALVEDVHKMMKYSVKKGVEFRTAIDIPKGKDWVLGDTHRLKQVLTNVTTNAIKYTLEGSITLAVSWKGNLVQLECIDTGPGIPLKEQERLFERFVQRGGAPGTGLGLNIALQIVNMMKGKIGFESDPTVKPGTTCRILLPMLLCQTPADPQRKSEIAQCIEDPIRILIVDDIKMNRTMLERRIKKAIAPNAQVTMAETAEEALEICETEEFDIIICDQYMEEAGGVLIGTDAIIAMRRNKVKSLIIGCSGNDLDNDFLEAGADLVWGKPMPSNSEIIRQWRDGLFTRSIQNTASPKKDV
eukprot:Nitzschia sp. Nitz4//scaffold26_size159584//56913//59963//NITZ4_002484-RA/size159584-snap-gene-0.14-mRNA-1//1//CDS//3329545061//6512//frame0